MLIKRIIGLHALILTSLATLTCSNTFGNELVIGPDGKTVYEKRPVTLYKVECKRVFKEEGSALPTPVIDHPSGRVYTGSYDGNVYELNPDYSLRRVLRVGEMIQATPLVMPGIGVVAVNTSGQGKVFLDGGRELLLETNGPTRATPIALPGNIFLTANLNGYIDWFKVENQTVTRVRHIEAPQSINASPVFFPDGSLVITSIGGHIYNLDSQSGKVIWQYPSGRTVQRVGAFRGAPVLTADPDRPGQLDVIAGSEDGYVYIRHSNHAVDKIDACGSIENTPLVLPNGNIAVGAGHRIVLLNRQKSFGGYETENDCFASPVYISSKDLIVAASMDGTVNFLRGDTGSICGIYKTGNAFQQAGCVVGDKVLIGDNNQNLCLYWLTDKVEQVRTAFVKLDEDQYVMGNDGKPHLK
jgi:outer membrane protein assembly factor BamB